jgi:hypothetical protein
MFCRGGFSGLTAVVRQRAGQAAIGLAAGQAEALFAAIGKGDLTNVRLLAELYGVSFHAH